MSPWFQGLEERDVAMGSIKGVSHGEVPKEAAGLLMGRAYVLPEVGN